MSDQRHARVKELYVAACERPPEARHEFLAEACGDGELRRQVESLLGHYAPPSLDLETALRSGVEADLRPAPKVGAYRLLQKLGEGGMGEVWEAEQERPIERRVALKLVRWGMSSDEVLARFDSERQALALMSHPNVAHIFDAGTCEDGRPYFAMELVAGVPITDYCDSHRLSTPERLELFVEVCKGVQHAHQRGIIHRDMKPSNVLVTVQDDGAVPKVIDFGVAKATAQRLTERTLFTHLGQWIGTPEYMSPEQAEMSGLDVDTRTDVYSLGALLYELLAGAQPFDGADLREVGFDEMRRRIREEEPPRPSTRVSTLGEDSGTAKKRRTDLSNLVHELRGDLDWITMKAMEKDRTRRYGSPAELAADVERHLRHEPVVASPPSTLYRARKFVRRHRLGVAAAALVAAALVIGLAVATAGLLQARQEAETSRRVADFLVGVFGVLDPGNEQGTTTSAQQVLARGAERIDAELAGEPLIAARLKLTLGRVYRNLGLYAEARPLLLESLATREELLGPDHPDVAESLSHLGVLLERTASFREAKQRHERALAIREKAFGPDHPDVGQSLSEVARESMRAGDLETARQLLERARTVLEAALGPDHPQLAPTLDRSANLLFRTGDFSGSRALLERSLEIREAHFGRDHIVVATSLFALAWQYRETGDLEAALPLFERVLEIERKTLSASHPSVADTLTNLGDLFLVAGDAVAARRYYEQALEILENSLEEHPLTTFVLDGLGSVALLAGDPDTARQHFERSLAIREKLHGARGHLTSLSLYHLGRAALLAGDRPRALALFEDTLAVREERFGKGHASWLEMLASIVTALLEGGELDEARRRCRELVTVAGDNPGEAARHYASTCRYNLACASARAGDRQGALADLEALVADGWADAVLLDDPDLDSLRGEAEFEALAAEVRRRLAGE